MEDSVTNAGELHEHTKKSDVATTFQKKELPVMEARLAVGNALANGTTVAEIRSKEWLAGT